MIMNGISTALLTLFCHGDSSVQDSIPYRDSLREANVTLSTMQDAQRESLILGNGDLYGIVWEKDETDKLIEWNATGIIPNVRIEYKTSSGGVYNPIIADDGGHTTAGPNQYTWPGPVPDVNSEDCYVRVSDVNYYDDVYAESQTPFSMRPVITVNTPAADDNLAVASNDNGGVAEAVERWLAKLPDHRS